MANGRKGGEPHIDRRSAPILGGSDEGTQVQMAAATHLGCRRERNEDAVYVDVEVGLAVIADGLGGHPSGDAASRIAVRCVSRSLSGARTWPMSGTDLLEAVNGAHHAIIEYAGQDRSHRHMGTTVVVAYVPPDERVVWIAHAGDSRAYLLHTASLRQLTEDHAVEVPGQGRPLTQSLGGPRLQPSVTVVDLHPGDRILLSTDGLHDVVDEQTILRLLAEATDAEAAGDALVEAALERGAPDNIGVAVIVLDTDDPQARTV